MNHTLTMFYDKPASNWENEALPIGNGRIGAMIFGGVATDRIQFNEETLFSGKPLQNEKEAYRYLNKIRQLLSEKKFSEAQKLVDQEYLELSAYGDVSGFGKYQTFGDIFISLHQDDTAENYMRKLDLSSAVAEVCYHKDGCSYTRSYFASHPADVIAVRYEVSSGNILLNAKITLAGGHSGDIITYRDDGEIFLDGSLENLDYQARLRVVCEGGSVSNMGNALEIKDCVSFTVYLSASTDYLPESDHYRGKDFTRFNQSVLDALNGIPYEQIRSEHIADFSAIFNKNTLFISDRENKSDIPTDCRIEKYKSGETDHSLEVLLYQYGRYQLISSSRNNTLPANLQGIWNDTNDPNWGSIFCYNINFNMNYWCAENTNLAECHTAAIRFIDSLRKSGRKAAEDYFDAGGWFASKKSDIWGFTRPYAKSVYGLCVGGSGWLCQDIWEHYNFNRNYSYLRQTAFPIMREAAEFYLDYLTENSDGYLVASPASSPENSYIYKGEKLNLCDGVEIDSRIIEELFVNCLRAAKILKISDSFTEKVQNALAKLCPVKMNENGLVQEWYHDFEQAEPNHRHLSFIYGLHPSQLVNPQKYPQIAQAYQKTLLARGEGNVGWSIAWRISIWARLMQGENAYKYVRQFLSQRIADNLFDVEPTYQIDGNLGFTAGIAEMLLQSDFDRNIILLPAIPTEWDTGKVQGLRARGNFTVDIEWSNNTLVRAVIHGDSNASGSIQYKNIKTNFLIPESGKFEFIL